MSGESLGKLEVNDMIKITLYTCLKISANKKINKKTGVGYKSTLGS